LVWNPLRFSCHTPHLGTLDMLLVFFPFFLGQKTGRDNDGECRVTGNRGGDRLSIYVCMDGKMAAFIRTELLTLPNDFLRNCAYGGTARVVSLFLKRVNGEPG
jgi:hypothetical protein